MAGLDAAALIIVEEALGLQPGPARDAFVRGRTEGNEALRRRVGQLLAHADLPQTEMLLPSHARPITLPDRVGPFRITGKIADGGMGVVARGERDDGVFEQAVAIKFIRSDLSSDIAVARFDAERRILAKLDHPSIARIIDGGSADGQPWLAMEFVDGLPLTHALDARGAAQAARLAAFLDVCEAVAVAHRNFVVHADIKPGNVMMRADGSIKLLDFGIARIIVGIEDEGAGERAPHPLTRGYAPPERTDGSAPTVAGDIFSLGMLLGETVPTQGDADLAAIVARATAADPHARYPDVAALAEDLRAYRDHYPVAARPGVDWRYRFAKFLRRHRTGAAVTAMVILLLAGAATFSTIAYVRAEQSRIQAEARFDEVRQLSRFLLFDLYDDLADSPGTLPVRVRLADTARRYLEQLGRVPDAPLDLRIDIARGWRRLATVEGVSGVSSLGRPDNAREALGRAEAEAQAILASDPDNVDALVELGWVSFGRWTLLGFNAESAAALNTARRHFDHALRLAPDRADARLGLLNSARGAGAELIGGNRPALALEVLRNALRALRARPFEGRLARDAALLEVNILNRIGDATYYGGDVPGALAPYREAEAIVRRELARAPSLVWIDRFAESKFNISGTLGELSGRSEEALAEARAGIPMLERALAFGPDVNLERWSAILYGQESLVLEALHRLPEAVEASERSVALRQRRLELAPSEPQNRRALAVAMPNHARLLAAGGRRADACAAVRQAVAQWQQLAVQGDIAARDREVELPQAEAAVRRYCG